MKICILRLSAIGDCINVVATIRVLQKYLPKAEITWIIGPASASLLKPLLPEINFIIYEKKGIKSIIALKKVLNNQYFDYLLMMQYALSASLASLVIKAGKKIGFDSRRSRDLQCLFCSNKIQNNGGRHIVDAFLDFAKSVVKTENIIKAEWNISIPQELIELAKEVLNVGNKKLCLINPCTSKVTKDWDLECCCDVIEHLNRKGFQVVLLGGKSLRELNSEKVILQRCNNVLSLVGKTSLSECMACISLGNLVISADTASVHMANALGIPVIGLYATHDPKRVGPYLDRSFCVSVYDDLIMEEYHQSSENLAWRTRVHTKDAMKRITSSMINNKIDLFCEKMNLDDK